MSPYDMDFMMYNGDISKSYCCFNLIHHSVITFKNVNIINNIYRLKRFLDGPFEDNFPFIPNKVLQATDDIMIDRIKIIMSYENFFKAMLLENGIIVHIENKKLLRNSNIILPPPMTIKDFFSHKECGFVKDVNTGEFTLKYLTKISISINKILNTNYQYILKIPKEIKDILNNIILSRNKHHLYYFDAIFLNKKEYEQYLSLIQYFNENIISKYNYYGRLIKSTEKYPWKDELIIPIPI